MSKPDDILIDFDKYFLMALYFQDLFFLGGYFSIFYKKYMYKMYLTNIYCKPISVSETIKNDLKNKVYLVRTRQ